MVLNSTTLEVMHEGKDSKQWISDIRYTPDGNTLGVASRDNSIYLYDVANGYLMKAKFSKHNSFITHFDFSTDCQVCTAILTLTPVVTHTSCLTRTPSVHDEQLRCPRTALRRCHERRAPPARVSAQGCALADGDVSLLLAHARWGRSEGASMCVAVKRPHPVYPPRHTVCLSDSRACPQGFTPKKALASASTRATAPSPAN